MNTIQERPLSMLIYTNNYKIFTMMSPIIIKKLANFPLKFVIPFMIMESTTDKKFGNNESQANKTMQCGCILILNASNMWSGYRQNV